MACECYKIGRPWIEEASCPAHGREAQQRERDAENLEARMVALEERVRVLEEEARI